MAGFGGAIKLTGESEYKKALNQITQSLKEVSSEMKVVTSAYDKNDTSVEALSSKQQVLSKQLTEQTSKLNTLKAQYSSMTAQFQEQTNKHNQLVQSYENEKAKLQTIGQTLGTTSKEYQAQAEVVNKLEKDVLKSSQAQDQNAKTMSNMRVQMNNATADVNKTANEIDKLEKEMGETSKSADELGKEVKDAGDKAQESANGGFTVFKGILANLGTQVINGAINGLKSMGNALVSLGKQAIQGYAEFEQLEGGVKTLFGTEANSVEEYAKSVGKSVDEVRDEYSNLQKAQTEVFKNANDAYKTAGLSANEYMETVTAFSASLISSLDGDTVAAAKSANQAITDMADNANKMGTDISSIQNAYQGFAKQNYTMLDNLKLGYGGTKTEMERLLADAEKLSGVKYDISNLNDVYEAIHVVQTEMGITGTTAKEASQTISGSTSAMKSAWNNLITGIANDNADFSQLVDNFVQSTITVMKNILPRIKTVVAGIGQLFNSLVEEVLPQILQEIPALLEGFLPILMESLGTLSEAILSAIEQLLPLISQMIPQLVAMLLELLPQLIDVGIQAIVSLIQGITQSLPQLIAMLPTIIKEICNTLLDNIGLIIDAGIELIFALTDGLIEALPELIDYIPEIIDKIIVAITENLPKIIEAGITLIIKLAEGLIKALPKLISKIPQIMSSLINGIISYYEKLGEIGKNLLSKLISGIGSMIGSLGAKAGEIVSTVFNTISQLPQKMLDIGKNLVQGLWNGISNMTSWVLEKIKGFGDSILSGIKSFFGIASPSKLFKNEVGKYLAEGIGVGFEDEMKDVTKEMQNAIPTSFDTDATLNGLSATAGATSSGSFDYLVDAFKEALAQMKIEMDDEEMGKFVDKTVARVVYS